MPAGFLHHLTVQGGDRMLSGVYAAAGQLKFGGRRLLKGGQQLIPLQQHRIDAGAPLVALPCLHRLAIAPYHPLDPELALPI